MRGMRISNEKKKNNLPAVPKSINFNPTFYLDFIFSSFMVSSALILLLTIRALRQDAYYAPQRWYTIRGTIILIILLSFSHSVLRIKTPQLYCII